jgi:high-affinity K+ transport system ATPase subunit B
MRISLIAIVSLVSFNALAIEWLIVIALTGLTVLKAGGALLVPVALYI